MVGCLLSSFVTFNSGTCAPAANLQLGSLLNQSDLVTVATIQSVGSSGSNVVFDLLVLRTMKGAITSGVLLSATWTPTAQPLGAGDVLQSRDTGIWFLKQNGTGWTVLPIAVGAVQLSGVYIRVPSAPLPAAFAYAPSAGGANRLAYELGAATQDATTAAPLAHILAGGAADDLGANVLSPIWNELSSSTTPLNRAIGIAGMIRFGNPTALAVLTAAGAVQGFGTDAQDHLSAAICGYRTNDSASIAGLSALTSSGYQQNVTLCAVHALRAIHSPTAVKYLVPLLDNSSVRVRYEAVAGIASFANGLSVQTSANTADMSFLAFPANAPLATADTRKNFPTLKAFEREPQVYVAFWKNWLTAHPIN